MHRSGTCINKHRILSHMYAGTVHGMVLPVVVQEHVVKRKVPTCYSITCT